MWLDRLATTPSGTPLPWSRAASPAPVRRSSHLSTTAATVTSDARRPGLPQRLTASALVNGSNGTSFSPSKVSTPSLRTVLTSDPSTSVESDSLGTLRGLFRLSNAHTSTLDAVPDKDDFGSSSLEAFAIVDSLDSHKGHEDIGLCDAPPFGDLQTSIAACDKVLASIESQLASFQADLATVATEIETLHGRSTTLSAKLQRRKEVEQALGPEMDSLLLPPATLRKVTNGPIDEVWIEALKEVETKIGQVDKYGANISAMRSVMSQDLRPLLVKVQDRAVERVREFVVAQIKALRTSVKNAQPIQRQRLLKQQAAFAYLSRQQPQLQLDIAQAYANTMKWYYRTNFMAYKQALDKVRTVPSDKASTFASEDMKKGPGLGHLDPFVLGRRSDAITSTTHAITVQAMAELSMVQLEVIFRTYNVALLDNASFEFSFLTSFFSQLSFHAVNRLFADIFEPAFALGITLTKSLTEHAMDGLGILLCVRLNQHIAFELQRRKVPSMDSYINGTSMLLWPRFQVIMDGHCDSLRRANAAIRASPIGSALGLTSAGGLQSAAPHAITQRFANFIYGIFALSADAGDDEPVQRSVCRLRDDFDAFLIKTSKSIAEAKKRDRFLSNNYSLICTIINDTDGKMADEMKRHYSSLQSALRLDGLG